MENIGLLISWLERLKIVDIIVLILILAFVRSMSYLELWFYTILRVRSRWQKE
jgi:hypothetical protein